MRREYASPHSPSPPLDRGFVRLYRAQPAATQVAAARLPDWITTCNTYLHTRQAEGRWFSDDLSEALWYLAHEYPDGEIVYVDVEASRAESFRVSNLPAKTGGKGAIDNPRAFSLRPEHEFFLPREISGRSKRLDVLHQDPPQAQHRRKARP